MTFLTAKASRPKGLTPLMIRRLIIAAVCAAAFFCGSALAAQKQPNIVWILVDDMSPHFSCCGETAIRTSNVDALAAEGTRFTRYYAAAPICPPVSRPVECHGLHAGAGRKSSVRAGGFCRSQGTVAAPRSD